MDICLRESCSIKSEIQLGQRNGEVLLRSHDKMVHLSSNDHLLDRGE